MVDAATVSRTAPEPDPEDPPVRRGSLRGGQRLRPVLGWLRRHLPRELAILTVAVAGAAIGAALAPGTTADVGPLQAEVRVVPSLSPGVHLLLPPAGQVEFDVFDAPVAIEARIAQVDLEGAQALIDSPAQLRLLGDTAPEEIRSAAIRAALTSVGCCLVGAALLSLLVFRTAWRRTAQVTGTVVVVLVATAGVAAATAAPERLQQPRFTGLLSQAPYIAGQVPGVLERLETYRSGLSDIVRSVTALYATAGGLPNAGAAAGGDDVVTVLHVSDIHLNPLAFDLIDKLVAQFGVDVVVDTGDITTWGTAVESATLSRIGQLPVPYVFVRGNHDSAATQAAVATNRNAVVLDGRVAEAGGLVFAGIGDPEFTPDGNETPAPIQSQNELGGTSVRPDPQEEANERLATAIDSWDEQNPGNPVQIAAVHEPTGLDPLLGRVPLLLAGHTHKREARLDASGTRILVEGSTGGAGITASGLERLSNGEPLPLAASLVHIATAGDRAGDVVAVDDITVGGFGLTSVNFQRTAVPPVTEPLEPVVTPTPTPTPTSTP